MRKVILLIFICLLASVLRIFAINRIPPALTWDEVAWGYNAYSLGLDGKDEFGRFLPLDYLESFGDFKPPVYAYLTILPVKLFGLNEFSTRLPSAIFGVLTVLITYFLIKTIFYKAKNDEFYAYATAFLLALSPWHINLSRAAFEANIASFFLITGVWLFLLAMRQNRWLLTLSVLSFVISLYTFNTTRIVAPLLVIILIIANYKVLLKNKRSVIVACFIGITAILPFLPFIISPQAKLRYQEVNIFSDINVIERTNRQILRDNNALWSRIIHNRRFAYSLEYIKHYLDNFGPQFLFITGDGNPKFSTQDVGQLYLWEIPFFLTGILILVRRREGLWWIIPVWTLVAVLPAATARETPHALRIETALPTFQLYTAIGLVSFLLYIKSKVNQPIRPVIYGIMGLFMIFNLVYYLNGYYKHYSSEYSGEWQYGYKNAIAFVAENYHRFDRVYMTEDLGRPYIYFLYYLKYDPSKFRSNAVVSREAFGFVHVRQFDKFYFANDFSSLAKSAKTLYIDIPLKVPQNAQILKTFYLLNNKPKLVAYTL